jgi:hypothetical protein
MRRFLTALYFSSYQKEKQKTAQMSGFSLIIKRQKLS